MKFHSLFFLYCDSCSNYLLVGMGIAAIGLSVIYEKMTIERRRDFPWSCGAPLQPDHSLHGGYRVPDGDLLGSAELNEPQTVAADVLWEPLSSLPVITIVPLFFNFLINSSVMPGILYSRTRSISSWEIGRGPLGFFSIVDDRDGVDKNDLGSGGSF